MEQQKKTTIVLFSGDYDKAMVRLYYCKWCGGV